MTRISQLDFGSGQQIRPISELQNVECSPWWELCVLLSALLVKHYHWSLTGVILFKTMHAAGLLFLCSNLPLSFVSLNCLAYEAVGHVKLSNNVTFVLHIVSCRTFSLSHNESVLHRVSEECEHDLLKGVPFPT